MDENKEIEIDFKKIFEMIKEKFVYIVLVTIIGGILSGCITNFFITPQYTASIKLYAWNNSETLLNNRSDISAGDIEAAQMLINTYLAAIESDSFIEKVADQVGNDLSIKQIRSMLNCSVIENTNIFQVSITSPNREQAAEIANIFADVCPDELVRMLKVGGVEIIDYAKAPTTPSSPNIKRNILVGAAAGFIISFALFFLMQMFDTSVNSEEDLKKEFDIPIIGSVPKLLPVTERNRTANDSEFLSTSSTPENITVDKEEN